MRNILVVLAVLLLAGCVMTQDEIDQVHAYMGEFSGEMQKTDQYMPSHQWAEAHDAYVRAEAVLGKIDALAATAEGRGADPAKIERIKAASAIVHEMLSYVEGLTAFYQDVEGVRAQMGAAGESMDYEAAKSLINGVIDKTDAMEAETNSMLASLDAYAASYPEDYAKGNLALARTNVASALPSLAEIKSNSQAGLEKTQ